MSSAGAWPQAAVEEAVVAHAGPAEDAANQPELAEVDRLEDEEVFGNDEGDENMEVGRQLAPVRLRNNLKYTGRAFHPLTLRVLAQRDISTSRWMSSATKSKSTKVKLLPGDSLGRWSLLDLLFCSSRLIDEIPLDVIDVLLSSSDFEEFKSLMLSYKQNETPCIEITGDALICCGD
ncbi:unnamed protein product [Phytophthora lilii]|uniref:Unnamed protein product n=1 Tax=Phytophthora lilii TaxID=2077276 RepID=A0A9W6X461_9STRA|nr:unnamed protein product [Phytophthora lilii]